MADHSNPCKARGGARRPSPDLPRRAPYAIGLLFACVCCLATATPAKSAPTLKETLEFARAELTTLCTDRKRSGIDALDRLQVEGRRACEVSLSTGRLHLSVRERGSEHSSQAYAQLKLSVSFTRDSGFLCGRTGADGMAPLFFTCQAAKGADGAICAERSVAVDDPNRDSFETTQMLAAASILRTDPKSCGIVARALSYIGERSKPGVKADVRDYFAKD